MINYIKMSKSFDQIVQGSIDIKNQSKNKYKITVRTNNQFLRYQVWSSDKTTVNSSRSVYQQSANDWVNQFNQLNASLKASNKPLFSPTTIMELGNDKYVFVIHKAQINKNGNMVFSVLTNEINLLGGTSKKMIKLPCGQYEGVRFDIDSSPNASSYSVTLGTSLGLASSWPLCFNTGSNTTLSNGSTAAFGTSGSYWTLWGYSSSPWNINNLSQTNTSGYLFIYNNYTTCVNNNIQYGANGADAGPSQLYITNYSSEINALNDPDQSIGGSLSQAILQYISNHSITQSDLFPNLTFDDVATPTTPNTIYYVSPQPPSLTYYGSTTFLLNSLPPENLGILTFYQFNIQTQIYNYFVSNSQGSYSSTLSNCSPANAALVGYDLFGIPTGIITISDQCSFTLTVTQNFYQNYNSGAPYAYSKATYTLNIQIT
jgi:hypothetical protein